MLRIDRTGALQVRKDASRVIPFAQFQVVENCVTRDGTALIQRDQESAAVEAEAVSGETVINVQEYDPPAVVDDRPEIAFAKH